MSNILGISNPLRWILCLKPSFTTTQMYQRFKCHDFCHLCMVYVCIICLQFKQTRVGKKETVETVKSATSKGPLFLDTDAEAGRGEKAV